MAVAKRYAAAEAQLDRSQRLPLEETLALAKRLATAKFDETIEMAVRLGVDPKHADQMVRGAVVLPAGTGKQVRVLVFAKGEKEREAREAGADYVGAEDFVQKIQEGWLEFDKAVATPDMMGLVGRLGKILGPRGLMPNPKVGTVILDVARAVREVKGGRIEFKVDKAGNLHVPLGKASFSPQQLHDNAMTFLEAVMRAKPASAKGVYLRSITVSSTMGPGIRVDEQRIANIFRR